ncbi:hypothetical protein V1264_004829 [Littorina saxatilis]|uniref:Uncharacterized protein n=1 Tax=Littorina saxatilis TaxID=31220 RepID=A0AAN9G8P7_9CAEN
MISGDYYHVTDTMLGASTSRDEGHGPPMSRIYPGNTAAWMSDSNDDKPWVGVHFETLVTVKGVTTTGGLGLGTWVTQYKLQYRYDNSAPLYWYTSLPGSGAQVFTGNSDASTPVTNNIDLPFAARQVFLYPVNWTVSSPALRWELQGCLEDECTPDYAVSGPLIVPDDNITVSSVSDPQHDAFGARLHVIAVDMKLSCWRPATLDTSQWIQVDFERVEVLRGVSTRGNPTAAEWVTSYLLLFRPDVSKDGDVSFKPYEEPYGTVKVFSGNTDSNTTVTNYLKSHIPTQHVRIQPQSWQAHIALQLDILVCQTGCQEQGLIKDVSDEQLTATSSEAHHGPAMVRLQPAGSPTSPLGTDHLYSGGWQAQFARQNEYIQVSLDLPQEIRAISTQGRHGSSNWVTSYSLTFSIDAKIWNNYTYDDTGSTMVFSGNYDADTVHKHYLTPFQAQYVRLHPVTWHGAVAMRWELHGCPGRNEMRVLGCYAEHPDDRDLPYEPYTDPMDGMDPLLCSRHCFNKGYYFAGLQARDKCYCGNSYGRYGPSADCNLWCFPQDQFICGGLAANFVYSTGLTSAFKVCPKGWPRLGEQCYSYTSTAYDWTSARAACAALRADLASVPDRNVNSLLYSLMGAASGLCLFCLLAGWLAGCLSAILTC